VFLVVTIPLARIVDWLLAREKQRRVAGVVRTTNPVVRNVGRPE
jgi:hypothetical protein